MLRRSRCGLIFSLNKMNASRPSEQMSKSFGGIIGYKDKTSSWLLNGFLDGIKSNIGSSSEGLGVL